MNHIQDSKGEALSLILHLAAHSMSSFSLRTNLRKHIQLVIRALGGIDLGEATVEVSSAAGVLARAVARLEERESVVGGVDAGGNGISSSSTVLCAGRVRGGFTVSIDSLKPPTSDEHRWRHRASLSPDSFSQSSLG